MEENRCRARSVIGEVEKSVVGKTDILRKVMTAILAGGHVLIEDIPGTGKTTLALSFSYAMGLKVNRVQFTPDVLPADLSGFTIYDKASGTFVYQPGAAICNLLLADCLFRSLRGIQYPTSVLPFQWKSMDKQYIFSPQTPDSVPHFRLFFSFAKVFGKSDGTVPESLR